MKQSIVHVAIVVRDYDEAIEFYVGKLGFELVEDTYQPEQRKRWVIVRPRGATECSILLARASEERQLDAVGNQTGGRVFLFLATDNLQRDFDAMIDVGIEFVRLPAEQSYGKVAVFKDLYGNLWDLVEYT